MLPDASSAETVSELPVSPEDLAVESAVGIAALRSSILDLILVASSPVAGVG